MIEIDKDHVLLMHLKVRYDHEGHKLLNEQFKEIGIKPIIIMAEENQIQFYSIEKNEKQDKDL